jgi:hypothetical protein
MTEVFILNIKRIFSRKRVRDYCVKLQFRIKVRQHILIVRFLLLKG